MRQPSADRALYLRQLRHTVAQVFLPELTSAPAIDAAALVDRILVELIVEEEDAVALSTEFGPAFGALLDPEPSEGQPVSPERFHEVRAQVADLMARTAASPAADRGRQVLQVERRFLERVDQRRRAVLSERTDDEGTPSPMACSVSPQQMTTYLRGRLPGSPAIAVERLSVVPGGRSKETILVTLSGTTELPAEVIVRQDRPVGLLHTRAVDEFAVIKAVHDFGGVPVPEPFFADEEGHGPGPGTVLVMERVPGVRAGEFFPDLAAPVAHRREIALALAAALARLHSMPVALLDGTSLEVPPAAGEDATIAAVAGLVSRIGELTGPPCAAVPLAHQWLVEHVSDVVPATTLSLLQGDFGFHNMLVVGARVTALVDWEAADIGPPSRELAAAWNAVTCLVPWSEFIEAYLDAGGPPEAADQRAIGYYRVLSSLGAFMASRTGGHLFRTGAKRDLLTAHSGLDSHFRCQRNLARALEDALHPGDV